MDRHVKKITKKLSASNMRKILDAIRHQPFKALATLLIPNIRLVFDAKKREPYSRNFIDINEIVDVLQSHNLTAPVEIHDFIKFFNLDAFVQKENELRLKNLFNQFGSDKSSNHNYEKIFQPILSSLLSIESEINLAEIGLGTYSLKIPSNMGIYGKPGASALAFVNYSNRINYLGGDIDKKILFSGERIITTWVNQLDRQTLRNFLSQRPINLLIDDGLHAPQSNLNTLLEFKSSAQKGSWIVIEDIDYIFTNFWLQMIPFLDAKMHCQLVKTSSALVFVAKIL